MSTCWQSGLSQSKINKIELFETHPLWPRYMGRSEMEKCLFWRQLNTSDMFDNWCRISRLRHYIQTKLFQSSFNIFHSYYMRLEGTAPKNINALADWHFTMIHETKNYLMSFCDCIKLIADYFYGMLFESNGRWFVSNK